MDSDHKVVAHNFDGYWRVSAQQTVQLSCQPAPACTPDSHRAFFVLFVLYCWLCYVTDCKAVSACAQFLGFQSITGPSQQCCLSYQCPQAACLLDTAMLVSLSL